MPCSDCKSITLFKGEDGRTIYNGSGSPSSGLGNEGDFYIDTDTWEIYGPKTSGSWGTGTSLVGPQGFQGTYGGWSSFWRYDGTSITSGTSAGDFRFNNGTLSAVDHLYINDVNGDSTNMQSFLDAWNNSGAFGLVRISKINDANEFWMGIVTAETDTGSEHDITVTHVVSNGTFTDNASYVISFVESGADGANGTNGADGANGVTIIDQSPLSYASPITTPAVTVTSAEFPNNGDTIEFSCVLETAYLGGTTTGNFELLINGVTESSKTLTSVRNNHTVTARLFRNGNNLYGTFTIQPIDTNSTVAANAFFDPSSTVANFFVNTTNTLSFDMTGNSCAVYFPRVLKILTDA